MQVEASRTDSARFSRSLFAGLPPRYDRLAWLLSFGQDRRWRAATVDAVASARPGRVLDVATGPAGVARALARRSDARIVGMDLSEDMLRQGVRHVAADPTKPDIEFVIGRGEELPFATGSFDGLMFTYLLRYVTDPAAVIAELARVVRPGGVLASLDFTVPPNPVWRAAWVLYTRAVLPVAGMATGGRAWWDVGRFLGPSISTHDERFGVDWTIEAWRAAGLVDVQARRMSLGGGLVMQGRKPA